MFFCFFFTFLIASGRERMCEMQRQAGREMRDQTAACVCFIFLMNKVPHISMLWSSLRGLHTDGGIQPATLQLLRATWTNALFRAGSPLWVCVCVFVCIDQHVCFCMHLCWSPRLLSKTHQSQSQVSLCPLLTLMNGSLDGGMDGWREGRMNKKGGDGEGDEWMTESTRSSEWIDGWGGWGEYVRWK